MTILNARQLRDFFDDATISRGVSYVHQHKVLEARIVEQTKKYAKIAGKVEGSNKQKYRVQVDIDLIDLDVEANCSCPVGYNCKHAVAVILSANHAEQIKPAKLINLEEPISYFLNRWIDDVGQHLIADDIAEKNDVVIFILNVEQMYRDKFLMVTPSITRKLKNGSWSKPKFYYPSNEHRKAQLSKTMSYAFGLLDLYGEQQGFSKDPFIVKGQFFDLMIEALIATGHTYWKTIESGALTLAEPINIEFSWLIAADGTQSLQPRELPIDIELLPTTPLYYIDHKKHCLGEVRHNFPRSIGSLICNLPPIPVSQASDFIKKMAERVKTELPKPKLFNKIQMEEHKPTPCLYIYEQELSFSDKSKNSYFGIVKENMILAELKFAYAGLEYYSNSDNSYFTKVVGDEVLQIQRDLNLEQQHVQFFCGEFDFVSLPNTKGITREVAEDQRLFNSFILCKVGDIERWHWFREIVESQLQAKGWKITYAPGEFFQAILEPQEWYMTVEEGSGIDWFGLELGIIINDEKVDLLPYLIEALKGSRLQSHHNKTVLLPIANKGLIPIPQERMEKIISVISQLLIYNTQTKRYEVQITKQKAALLAEMERAFAASELRKFGDEKLLEIGRQLLNFKKIKKAIVPKTFVATLRPYQQQGVNWLQFLREYHLGGILADDMGLGKTIQTLAHLSIEKKENRLVKPSMIIAPTSVVFNWAAELLKFASNLSYVLWHGDKRAENTDKLFKADLVLTTYPLIVRDTKILLEQEYYLLILDEAQTIKNAQAKMTQVVQQFKAEHRICLTGTPLENHLGELWSQFNFLMPGLLGGKEKFTTQYRNPIEKYQNKEIQQQLSYLIRPFMLRRTKKEVIQELPDKTEIIQSVELSKEQRDLYETIRLSMNKKIHKAIAEKGLERSQIIILDALLKLRQVCCHPQLLSMEEARDIHESAKLDALMELILEMVQEGRKILLFSQFTSMLAIIENLLVDNKISFVKLIGSTKDRQTPIDQFQTGAVPIFLISLKAGGMGLNLTAADTVIHFDPWWNPAAENQATDRAHRIGQKQAVFVYKFICKNTVEEKILEMQAKKKSLMDAIFSDGTHKGKITKADLEALFGS